MDKLPVTPAVDSDERREVEVENTKVAKAETQLVFLNADRREPRS